MTAPSATIRPAQLEDGPAIYTFLCDLESQLLNRPAFDTVFVYNLTTPTIFYFVAEWHTDIIGFISCHVQYLLHHTGPVGEIQELYVRTDYRNQGIGQQLLVALETELASLGLKSLEVTTNRIRTNAIRFYESLAFLPTHTKLVKAFPA